MDQHQKKPATGGGLDVIYEPRGETDIDIVAVHGLGVDPDKSWNWEDGLQSGSKESNKGNSFNWLRSDDGLRKRFPNARIMLYRYMSAWQKKFRVRQSLDAIATPLISGLREKRNGYTKRPIIFICHCFGGIVVAKALSKESDESDILQSTAGCLFFGTPFKGVELARLAIYWETVRTHGFKNDEDYTDLLEFVKWESDNVMDLRANIRALTKRLKPEIPVSSVFELQPIDWSGMVAKQGKVKLPQFMDKVIDTTMGKLLKKSGSCFVEKESATLFDEDNHARDCKHSDLVRFASNKDGEYEATIGQIAKFVESAPSLVKARYNQRKVVNDKEVSSLRDKFDTGVSMKVKRDNVSKTLSSHSFIEDDPDFDDWHNGLADSKRCMFIVGPTGLGKTAASLAAIAELEEKIANEEKQSPGGEPMLLAWFLVDSQTDCHDAENLLKSILLQLLNQMPRLANHASKFVKTTRAPDKAGEDPKKSKHTIQMTVEHLWQCLLDMLSDDSLKRAYIIINNLHLLDSSHPATAKFLQLVADDIKLTAATYKDPNYRRSDRWLFTTSTNFWNDLSPRLIEFDDIQMMNLLDSKYENEVDEARITYVNERSTVLAEDVGYYPGLAFEVRDVMTAKAENGKWTDILCLRLAALPPDDRLAIVECLDHLPSGNLQGLIEDTWQSIFDKLDTATTAKLKDVLCTLVLVMDDITIPDLHVLTRYSIEELRQLLWSCYPLLEVDGIDEDISFADEELKTGLLAAWGKLLGFSNAVLNDEDVKKQIARRHGVMALNCLTFFRGEVEESLKAKAEEQSNAAAAATAAAAPGAVPPTPGTIVPEVQGGDSTAPVVQADDGAGQTNAENPEIIPDGTNVEIQDSKNEETEVGNEQTEEETPENDDGEDGEEVEEEFEDTQSEIGDHSLLSTWSYAVNWWMDHAEAGGKGAARSLCQDMKDFWTRDSDLRYYWFSAYLHANPDPDADPHMLPLHVTAYFGLKHLTNALLLGGHQPEVNEYQNGFTPLHFAAGMNHIETLNLLLDKGVTVNISDNNVSPLHLAAMYGRVEIMKILIYPPHNISVNAVCSDMGSVLHAAILSGVEAAVDLLLNHPDIILEGFNDQSEENNGANKGNENHTESVNALDNQNAQNTGNAENNEEEDEEAEEDIPPLLSQAAKVSEVFLRKLLRHPKAQWDEDDLDDAIWEACDNGRTESVDVLMKWRPEDDLEGTDRNEARQKSIEVLLQWQEELDDSWLSGCMNAAALQDFWPTVRTILEQRKNGALNCESIFFLAATSQQDQQEILEEIWGYTKAQIPKSIVNTTLYQATDNEKIKSVKWLIEVCNADPNATSEKVDSLYKGCYPADAQNYGDALTAAAFDGNTEIMQILLDRRATVDSMNGAALQMAAMQGKQEAVQLLLDKGADPNRILSEELLKHLDQSGSLTTALQAASDNNQPDIAKLLLDRGANPNLGGGDFMRPIITATYFGNEALLNHLLDATPIRVDVNFQGGPENTFPLTNAAYTMKSNCVERLLDSGAKVNAIDADEDQAIHCAIACEDKDVLRLLISRGAEVAHKSTARGFPLQYALDKGYFECAKIISDAMTTMVQETHSTQPSHPEVGNQPTKGANTTQEAGFNGSNSRSSGSDDAQRKLNEQNLALQHENQELTSRLQHMVEQYSILQEKLNSLQNQLNSSERSVGQKTATNGSAQVHDDVTPSDIAHGLMRRFGIGRSSSKSPAPVTQNQPSPPRNVPAAAPQQSRGLTQVPSRKPVGSPNFRAQQSREIVNPDYAVDQFQEQDRGLNEQQYNGSSRGGYGEQDYSGRSYEEENHDDEETGGGRDSDKGSEKGSDREDGQEHDDDQERDDQEHGDEENDNGGEYEGGQHEQGEQYEHGEQYDHEEQYGEREQYEHEGQYGQRQQYGQEQQYNQGQQYGQRQQYSQGQQYGQEQQYDQGQQQYGQGQQYWQRKQYDQGGRYGDYN